MEAINEIHKLIKSYNNYLNLFAYIRLSIMMFDVDQHTYHKWVRPAAYTRLFVKLPNILCVTGEAVV